MRNGSAVSAQSLTSDIYRVQGNHDSDRPACPYNNPGAEG